MHSTDPTAGWKPLFVFMLIARCASSKTDWNLLFPEPISFATTKKKPIVRFNRSIGTGEGEEEEEEEVVYACWNDLKSIGEQDDHPAISIFYPVLIKDYDVLVLFSEESKLIGAVCYQLTKDREEDPIVSDDDSSDLLVMLRRMATPPSQRPRTTK